jgi:hypothetical protein
LKTAWELGEHVANIVGTLFEQQKFKIPLTFPKRKKGKK